MLTRGLLEEIFEVFLCRILTESPDLSTSELKERIYAEYPTASMSIGCKEAIDYLLDLWTSPVVNPPKFLQFLETFQVHTRQFARRQISWFRNSKVTDYVWMASKGTTDQKYPAGRNRNRPSMPTHDVEAQLDQIQSLVFCSKQELEVELASPERKKTKEALSTLQRQQEKLQKEYISRRLLYTGSTITDEIDNTIGMIKRIKK